MSSYDNRGGGGSYYGPSGGGNNGGGDRGRSGYGGGFYGGGGGFHGGGGDFHQRDRSRSRDPPPGGRGYGGGGRGGRGGGGRGSKGDPMVRRNLESNGILVVANQFNISFINDQTCEWYQYKLQINGCRRKKDESGKFINDEEGKPLFVTGKDFFKDNSAEENGNNFSEGNQEESSEEDKARQNRSSPLTRRVILQAQAEMLKEGKFFVADGNDIAYSPSPLFHVDTSEQKEEKTGSPEPMEAESPFIHVLVRADCDPNHPDVERSRLRWFKVTFQQVSAVTFSVVQKRLTLINGNPADTDFIVRAVNVTFNNQLMKSMKSFGKSPSSFFFDPKACTSIFPPGLTRNGNIYRSEANAPLIGLSLKAHLSGTSQLMVLPSLPIQWTSLEFDGVSNKRIPILQPKGHQGGEVFGIHLESLHHPIPIEKRKEIEQVLTNKFFNVVYHPGKKWEAKQHEIGQSKGWSSEKITSYVGKRKEMVQLNKKVWKKSGPFIEFEPDRHSFEASVDGQKKNFTVREYMQEKWDIKIDFPQMPLIRISEHEWFPFEFLFQSQDSLKGANKQTHIDFALRFHDEFAGEQYCSKLSNILFENRYGFEDELAQSLEKLNLRIEHSPQKVKAKVLKTPSIFFEGASPIRDIKDGSWNLRDKTFHSPSSLFSFAVLDLVGNTHAVQEVLKACIRHKMDLPRDLPSLVGNVSIRFPVERAYNHDDLKQAYKKVKSLARDFFLLNQARLSKFPCKIETKNGIELDDCFVIWESGRPSLIRGNVSTEDVPFDPNTPHPSASHFVWNKQDNKPYQARLGFLFNGEFKDIFEPALNFLSMGKAYKLIEKGIVIPENDPLIERIEPIRELLVPPNLDDGYPKIGCPDIVFFLIPKHDTRLYNLIKLISNLDDGCQSQVLVQESISKQRGRMENYCSNVAEKINTKLANNVNAASSWTTNSFSTETLIIGISSCSQMGDQKCAKMICTGTAHLDSSGLRCCHESSIEERKPIISEDSIIFIVKSLVKNYLAANRGQSPRKCLIFRSSGQEGSFAELVEKELGAVKKAFSELAIQCDFTFVVAQNNVQIRITPCSEDRSSGWNETNVPSGTCIDDPSFLSSGGSLGSNETFDFFLTPHGGLKGTSRAMKYRVLRNECGFSQEQLENLTYQLSFRYGTATKAPRAAAVIQYSTRLSNTILSNCDYLFQDRNGAPKRLDDRTIAQERNSYFSREGDPRIFPDGDPRIYPDFSAEIEPPFHTHLAC